MGPFVARDTRYKMPSPLFVLDQEQKSFRSMHSGGRECFGFNFLKSYPSMLGVLEWFMEEVANTFANYVLRRW